MRYACSILALPGLSPPQRGLISVWSRASAFLSSLFPLSFQPACLACLAFPLFAPPPLVKCFSDRHHLSWVWLSACCCLRLSLPVLALLAFFLRSNLSASAPRPLSRPSRSRSSCYRHRRRRLSPPSSSPSPTGTPFAARVGVCPRPEINTLAKVPARFFSCLSALSICAPPEIR